ncbi:MAG: DUF1559 domain-containing protein [Pirellulales bacterium]|nr:DUF1559 domain-containing protein [Pirellulales bacterium]
MFRTHKATLCVTLSVLVAVSPSVVLAQQAGSMRKAAAVPSATTPVQKIPAKKLDVSYITPGANFAGVAHPRRVLTAPEMELMPVEVFSAAGKKELGIDPVDIEQIMLIVEPPTRPGPPDFGIVVRFSREYNIESLLPNRLDHVTAPAMLEGKPYRRAVGPKGEPSLFMPDDRTLLVAPEGMLQKMLAQKKKPVAGTMARVLGSMNDSEDAMAILMVEPLRAMIHAALIQNPPQVPPPLTGLYDAHNLISVVGFKAKLTGPSPRMLLSVRANDEAAAVKLEHIVNTALDFARQMTMAEMTKAVAQGPGGDTPVKQAFLQYGQRMNRQMIEALRPVRKGDRLMLSTEGQPLNFATIGVLVALLLPGIHSAREAARRAHAVQELETLENSLDNYNSTREPLPGQADLLPGLRDAREAARRARSANNMRQLGLALLNHESAHKQFPARANFDAQGKPLLSWRVHILPYIEQQGLYERFHLDEPWDSPHNKKLIPLMPIVFQNPSAPVKPGMASYLAPVGPGLMFEGKKVRRIREITDGTAHTILLLEADPDKAVEWTKPDDWNYDPKNPLAGLGKAHPGGFTAVFVDGSVHFLPAKIKPVVFKALLTAMGGETVDSSQF